mgnify:CR=1 FL=1|jgi:hypothetical protein
MKERILINSLVIFILLISSMPLVMAIEHLNASDFGNPTPQGVEKDYYQPGERLEFIYYIRPASESKKTILDGEGSVYRYYNIYSSLDTVTLEATVFLATGASIKHQYVNGKCQNPKDICDFIDGTVKMSFSIGDTANYGVDYIEVRVKGVVPTVQKRLETVKALYIEVSDADTNALPPVDIKVFNLNQFTADINSLKQEYITLQERSNELEEEGAVTAEAKDYLEKARDNLTVAENYYKIGDYSNADNKLINAEEFLDKTSFELSKAEANFIYEKAGNELEKLSIVIVQFDYTIREAKDINIPVSSYELQLITLKSKYTNLIDKNDKTADYLEKNKFDDVIERSRNIMNETAELTMQANSLISELRKKIDEAKETPTPTPTPTPTQETSFFFEQRDRLILIGAIVAALIGGGGAAYIALTKYKHKKSFDELK